MLDHKLRSKGIGSSEIAMLLGLSPWGGPHTLWRSKVGLDNDKQSAIMRRGLYIERAILDWYQDTHCGNNALKRAPGTRQHAEYPWVIDSVDGIVGDCLCSVEAKTVYFTQKDHWDDGVPLYYQPQCQWHCGVWGTPYCDVPVDFGNDFALYRVDFDEDIFNRLVEIARVFWETYVVTGLEPDLDETKETNQWLSKYREQKTDKIREATTDEIELMVRYRDLKIATKEIIGLEIRLKDAIGSDDGIQITGTPAIVTHRARKDGKRVLRTKELVDWQP